MALPSRILRPLAALVFVILAGHAAQAIEIERVVSPKGIEAWLVHDETVPLIAMSFAFAAGSTQDPAGREGVANLMSGLLDEGAAAVGYLRKAFEESPETIQYNLHTRAVLPDLVRSGPRMVRDDASVLARELGVPV